MVLTNEFDQIRDESTSNTLKRRSVKNGKMLSKKEAIEFYSLLNELNPEKIEHLEKITKTPGHFKRNKQYSLYKQLGF